ncbi:hypothetical protein MC77_007475 [Citrobacter koseri]|nr:hypothetical protein MC77_007475 [Citrobacter koseri]
MIRRSRSTKKKCWILISDLNHINGRIPPSEKPLTDTPDRLSPHITTHLFTLLYARVSLAGSPQHSSQFTSSNTDSNPTASANY